MRLHNYWWLLLWPMLFGILSKLLNMRRVEYARGEIYVRWTSFATIILSVPYVLWAGWRRWFGDTEQYRSTFKSIPSDIGQIIPYMRGVQKGPGFRLFGVLFKSLVSQSDVAYFTVLAAIQIACLVYIYRKYSPDFWLSIFLFVASSDYLSWMHNGIRQFTAASLVFLCLPLISEKKYIHAIILTLLATSIHSTVLIFLPFIFIVGGKPWNYRTLGFMAAIIVAVIFADNITGFLTEALVETVYERNIELLIKDSGTNIFRVLFYSVPAVMSFVFRPFLERLNDPVLNTCVNLSIVTAGFYIFSFFTSGILMGAIPIYFSLSNYILIPWLLREVFKRESVLVVEFLFAAVYVLFFIYQCGVTWGLLW